MTKKYDGDSNSELDAIGFGCNYIPFSGKNNPCAPKHEDQSFMNKQAGDLSADEHADKLFQFCGQDIFAPEAGKNDSASENININFHSPSYWAEEE